MEILCLLSFLSSLDHAAVPISKTPSFFLVFSRPCSCAIFKKPHYTDNVHFKPQFDPMIYARKQKEMDAGTASRAHGQTSPTEFLNRECSNLHGMKASDVDSISHGPLQRLDPVTSEKPMTLGVADHVLKEFLIILASAKLSMLQSNGMHVFLISAFQDKLWC